MGLIQVSGELLPIAGVFASISCACPHPGPSEFTSFDGGITWRGVRLPAGNVTYQDANHWWAINGRVLLKSPDAGQTWVQVTDKLPDWQAVPHVLDSRHAWALLFDGIGLGLGMTSDGGLHWTRAAVPKTI